MGKLDVDVVVVGAGAAGICCAGTLAERGVSVALVAETPDVAWQLRPIDLEGNHGMIQHPVCEIGWSGGWWYQLARRLNVPVQFQVSPPLELFLRGSPASKLLRNCASASALVDVFAEMSPISIDEFRGDIERIFLEVLAMDWRDLARLCNTPMSQWLEERNAHPVLQGLMYLFVGNMLETTPAQAQQHASVWTAFGMLRGCVGGEALMTSVKPDIRAGLLVPLTEAIEARGNPVLRGSKVSEVIFEGDRAVGVALANDTEVRGGAVAIATGTSRVPKLMPVLPDEVQAAVDHDAQLGHEDVCLFAVINRPLVTVRGFTLVTDETGRALTMLLPLHSLAPWSTLPGKQFLASQSFRTPGDFAKAGGEAGIASFMCGLNEELFPGFTEATEATMVQRHRHHWLGHASHGPKLPRRHPDLPGVYFVGDGSFPVMGMVGVEAAAGAGVCGAQEIIADLAR